MTVRLLSYNVRYAELDVDEHAWAERRDGVASLVRFHDPDVVCLQEVWREQLSDLRERLPAYGWAGEHVLDGEHTPVGYRPERFSVADEGVFSLSETPEDPTAFGWDSTIPRISTEATLHDETSGDSFGVVNTHFEHAGERARRESAALLAERVGDRRGPTVLAGDLNCRPGEAPYEALVESGLRDARTVAEAPHGPETTFNDFEAPQPGDRIDHVFLAGDVDVERFGVLADLDARAQYPSDHFALLVDLRFP